MSDVAEAERSAAVQKELTANLVECRFSLWSRRLWPFPEFSRFSRDEKVQKLPAKLISSELGAHQMSPCGVAPHWRSRPALQPDRQPRCRRVTSRSAGYDCVNNAIVSELKGGDPRTDQTRKGTTRTPGWHPEEAAS